MGKQTDLCVRGQGEGTDYLILGEKGLILKWLQV